MYVTLRIEVIATLRLLPLVGVYGGALWRRGVLRRGDVAWAGNLRLPRYHRY